MDPAHPTAEAVFRDVPLRSRKRPVILLVDDDLGTCETFQWVLRTDGYDIETARSGFDALAWAGRRPFDLMLVDLRLPDILGTDLVRAINATTAVPFVLISAFLTTEITVEAMRLGAANVVEKPITIEVLRGTVASLFRPSPGNDARVLGVVSDHRSMLLVDPRPASTADRWAQYVVKASNSEKDLTTVGAWGVSVGASRTSLSETCRLLGIDPRDARDLTRLVRALIRSPIEGCPPEALLLISDARTLKALFERGGLILGSIAGPPSLDHFLVKQQFVSVENQGVRSLRRLLKRPHS